MDDDLTLKFRGRSVDLAAGDKFELPFESPLGGWVEEVLAQDGEALDVLALDAADAGGDVGWTGACSAWGGGAPSLILRNDMSGAAWSASPPNLVPSGK